MILVPRPQRVSNDHWKLKDRKRASIRTILILSSLIRNQINYQSKKNASIFSIISRLSKTRSSIPPRESAEERRCCSKPVRTLLRIGHGPDTADRRYYYRLACEIHDEPFNAFRRPRKWSLATRPRPQPLPPPSRVFVLAFVGGNGETRIRIYPPCKISKTIIIIAPPSKGGEKNFRPFFLVSRAIHPRPA